MNNDELEKYNQIKRHYVLGIEIKQTKEECLDVLLQHDDILYEALKDIKKYIDNMNIINTFETIENIENTIDKAIGDDK